ncbi:MAG: methylenetetrahydrofolate reductase [Betaproteobacteria bacterium]
MAHTADAAAGDGLRERIIAFARRASIEATPHDEARLPALLASLRKGTIVYVAHPPRWRLQDVVRVAIGIRRLGFAARPHIVARALPSERALRTALADLNAAGIDQILVVAGDAKAPAGPFAGTQDVLDSGATAAHGMRTVAVAGHPQGHPFIATDALWEALQARLAFAQRTGTRVEIVTQFGFDPQAIIDWHRACLARGITLPLNVGIAGPAPLSKLLHFAIQCGIGASLRGLGRNPGALAGFAGLARGPEEMVTGLVEDRAASDGLIDRPHFYCFGGSLETARWLDKVAAGSFDLAADRPTFSVRA